MKMPDTGYRNSYRSPVTSHQQASQGVKQKSKAVGGFAFLRRKGDRLLIFYLTNKALSEPGNKEENKVGRVVEGS